jgi:hypothetical protein
MVANTAPARIVTPQKMINPEKLPFSALTIAPATGLPIRAPIAATP